MNRTVAEQYGPSITEDVSTSKKRGYQRRAPWSSDEEEALVRLHAEHGSSFSVIAQYLDGRTALEVKNAWYSTLRSKTLGRRSQLKAYIEFLGDPATATAEIRRAAYQQARALQGAAQGPSGSGAAPITRTSSDHHVPPATSGSEEPDAKRQRLGATSDTLQQPQPGPAASTPGPAAASAAGTGGCHSGATACWQDAQGNPGARETAAAGCVAAGPAAGGATGSGSYPPPRVSWSGQHQQQQQQLQQQQSSTVLLCTGDPGSGRTHATPMGRDSCVDISNMDPGSCQPSPAGCSVTGPATTPLASYAPTPLTGCGPGAAALGDPGPQGPAPAPASGAGGAGACHVGAASGAGTAVAGVGCAGSMNGSSSPRVGLGLGSWACSGGGGGAGGVPGNGLGTGADTPEWSTVFEQESTVAKVPDADLCNGQQQQQQPQQGHGPAAGLPQPYLHTTHAAFPATAAATAVAANPYTWEPNGMSCGAATTTASAGSLGRPAAGGLATPAPTYSSEALVAGPCDQVHDGSPLSPCGLERTDSLDRLLDFLNGTGDEQEPVAGAAAAEGPSMQPAEAAALRPAAQPQKQQQQLPQQQSAVGEACCFDGASAPGADLAPQLQVMQQGQQQPSFGPCTMTVQNPHPHPHLHHRHGRPQQQQQQPQHAATSSGGCNSNGGMLVPPAIGGTPLRGAPGAQPVTHKPSHPAPTAPEVLPQACARAQPQPQPPPQAFRHTLPLQQQQTHPQGSPPLHTHHHTPQQSQQRQLPEGQALPHRVPPSGCAAAPAAAHLLQQAQQPPVALSLPPRSAQQPSTQLPTSQLLHRWQQSEQQYEQQALQQQRQQQEEQQVLQQQRQQQHEQQVLQQQRHQQQEQHGLQQQRQQQEEQQRLQQQRQREQQGLPQRRHPSLHVLIPERSVSLSLHGSQTLNCSPHAPARPVSLPDRPSQPSPAVSIPHPPQHHNQQPNSPIPTTYYSSRLPHGLSTSVAYESPFKLSPGVQAPQPVVQGQGPRRTCSLPFQLQHTQPSQAKADMRTIQRSSSSGAEAVACPHADTCGPAAAAAYGALGSVGAWGSGQQRRSLSGRGPDGPLSVDERLLRHGHVGEREEGSAGRALQCMGSVGGEDALMQLRGRMWCDSNRGGDGQQLLQRHEPQQQQQQMVAVQRQGSFGVAPGHGAAATASEPLGGGGWPRQHQVQQHQSFADNAAAHARFDTAGPQRVNSLPADVRPTLVSGGPAALPAAAAGGRSACHGGAVPASPFSCGPPAELGPHPAATFMRDPQQLALPHLAFPPPSEQPAQPAPRAGRVRNPLEMPPPAPVRRSAPAGGPQPVSHQQAAYNGFSSNSFSAAQQWAGHHGAANFAAAAGGAAPGGMAPGDLGCGGRRQFVCGETPAPCQHHHQHHQHQHQNQGQQEQKQQHPLLPQQKQHHDHQQRWKQQQQYTSVGTTGFGSGAGSGSAQARRPPYNFNVSAQKHAWGSQQELSKPTGSCLQR